MTLRNLNPSNVTGVIVTRGDCDLEPCLATWPREFEVIVWDNSIERDVACFGRWLAAQRATRPVVFMQDDDTIVPRTTIDALLAEFTSDDVLLANMNDEWLRDDPSTDPKFRYDDLVLEAAGALVLRDAWEPAVIEYLARYPEDRFFYEWADFVVGILTPHRRVSLPYEVRDLAYRPTNLANTVGNRVRRKAMMQRARALRP